MAGAAHKYNVTLFADASTAPKEGRAGWGAWMIGNDPARASLGVCGPLPFDKLSNTCELRALVSALEFARDDGFLRDTDERVLLQSDSTEALRAITAIYPRTLINAHPQSARMHRVSKIPRWVRDEGDRLRAVLDPTRVEVHLRHVRGHTRGSGRNWVNRECDRLAKMGRKLSERRVDWRNTSQEVA